MIASFLQDVVAFLDQFIPSPIALVTKYRFSPSDLAIGGAHHASTCSASSARDNRASNNVLATFDVLSYNINNVAVRSPERRRRILHAIFSSGADVILLQETNPAWEDVLREDAVALQFRHTHFHHPGATDRAAGGIAVLSQYPLDNVNILDFTEEIDGSVFPALTCEVKMPIGSSEREADQSGRSVDSTATINIANVHLRPPVELDGSAWLDTARKTEPIRMREVKELIQRSAGGILDSARQPFNIIAGDFNEGDGAGALSYLASLGYTDALQRYVPRRKETHTWPFLRNLWTLRKRLDHILWHEVTALKESDSDECTAKLRCLGCGVLSGYEDGASDHQPVLSRFAIVER